MSTSVYSMFESDHTEAEKQVITLKPYNDYVRTSVHSNHPDMVAEGTVTKLPTCSFEILY